MCFNQPGEFPVAAIRSALCSAQNPRGSRLVKLFGRQELGIPREKLFLVGGDSASGGGWLRRFRSSSSVR